jgi:methanethiol S-methyltransferase
MLKVAAAVGGFGLVHSALASRAAKRTAAETFGERNRNGLYRVFYIGQSLVSFAILADYIRRQPSRDIYQVQGPLAFVMHAGQVAAVACAFTAANQVGIRRITGWESFEAWLGDGPVPPEPEAQGPALDAEGRMRAAGPFAWSRHPLNFVPVPIFWLWPRMTTNLLAFNVATTMYLVIGSWHEEARLRQAYGERYISYQNSGVPYYLPRPARSAATPLEEAGVPLLEERK